MKVQPIVPNKKEIFALRHGKDLQKPTSSKRIKKQNDPIRETKTVHFKPTELTAPV